MNEERKTAGLRVALVSYDTQELRVWHHYLAEQSADILCSEYHSGEEVLQTLRQGRLVDVVVLGGQLEDMDSMEFLARMSKLRRKPLLLMQEGSRRDKSAAASLTPDGPCYLVRQTSLKDLLQTLLSAVGPLRESPEQMCRRLYAEWGVVQPDSNCDYLTEAVLVAADSKRKLAIRKEILQTVAERHRVTVAAVDSGLRRLIENFETRRTPAWVEFKQRFELEGRRISAGKMIYTLRALIEPEEH